MAGTMKMARSGAWSALRYQPSVRVAMLMRRPVLIAVGAVGTCRWLGDDVQHIHIAPRRHIPAGVAAAKGDRDGLSIAQLSDKA